MLKEHPDKHNKYNDFYKNNIINDKMFWGLGIENESYLMFKKQIMTEPHIFLNNKRERYSVDYYKNYKKEELLLNLKKITKPIMLPVYINSYMFQNADINGEHIKNYTKKNDNNIKFNGTTIDSYMRNNSMIYNKLFEKNMIFDGDTFEFTTSNFYKVTVSDTIKELKTIKKMFIDEINKKLVGNGIFKDEIIYPEYNHGFVRYLTNMDNLGICNNGTYHINITLPTHIINNNIVNEEEFKKTHMNAINIIQWIEPLLIALYGTPDILSLYDKYNKGSLRLTLSRYIGIGTYDTTTMIPGKLLNNSPQPEYFKNLHKNSLYIPPETIGYDINYNKFKNHGIEIRIFDYIPENHLEQIMNFIILCCEHSLHNEISSPINNNEWNKLVTDILRNGCETSISENMIRTYFKLFNIKINKNMCCFKEIDIANLSIYDMINHIGRKLYEKYNNTGIVKLMAPNMKPISFSYYNSLILYKFKATINQ